MESMAPRLSFSCLPMGIKCAPSCYLPHARLWEMVFWLDSMKLCPWSFCWSGNLTMRSDGNYQVQITVWGLEGKSPVQACSDMCVVKSLE